MERFKMLLAYDGSAFYGYAKQPNLPSVEGTLERALARLGISSPILCAGRTDRGVHALYQVISFSTPLSLQTLQRHLPPKLPASILCKGIQEVPLDFHPRFDATWRLYRYICTNIPPSPFLSRFIAHCAYGPLKLIQEALNLFVGTHDFKFFCKRETRHTQRMIHSTKVYQRVLYNHPCIVIAIRAPSFLRAQVRLMVSAALAHSLGKLSLEDLKAQIAAQQRHHHLLAPPQGLYLARVGYPPFAIT
ncbi:tRNA pseudouridine(38-40) synthase TruA [Helicobacter felis]|uniref:tRNA pseudouridine(38-40) synthase TruA n=1 Tax=Helicobacter felis TaxID=214 RepID=UPI000CF0D7FA|nr:tRNA pseudouridine(38-40) synthase TruA [Helicobacter felis]